jgi:hypothetical protein
MCLTNLTVMRRQNLVSAVHFPRTDKRRPQQTWRNIFTLLSASLDNLRSSYLDASCSCNCRLDFTVSSVALNFPSSHAPHPVRCISFLFSDRGSSARPKAGRPAGTFQGVNSKRISCCAGGDIVVRVTDPLPLRDGNERCMA